MPIHTHLRALGMRPTVRLLRLPLLALATFALLAACGGDDDGDEGEGGGNGSDAIAIASPADLTSYRFTLSAKLTDFSPDLSTGADAESGDTGGADTDAEDEIDLGALGLSLDLDLDLEGAFVAPDRTQVLVDADFGLFQLQLEGRPADELEALVAEMRERGVEPDRRTRETLALSEEELSRRRTVELGRFVWQSTG